jgi:hypothetical protein
MDEAKLRSKVQDPVQGASINAVDASDDIRQLINRICQLAEPEAAKLLHVSTLKLRQDVEAHCGQVPRASPRG